MRIILSSAGPLDGQLGGGQVYVQDLATELADRGHQLAIIAPNPWRDGTESVAVDRYTWRGIPVFGVSVNPKRVRRDQIWSENSAPLLQAMGEIVEEARPQLMHLNGMKPALTSVALQRHVPHVITAHHGGLVCPAGALLRPDDSICQRPMDRRWCVSCYCHQLHGAGRAAKALASVPRWLYRPTGAALNVLSNPTYAGRVAMYPWLIERGIEAKQFAVRRAQLIIAPSRAIADAIRRNGVPADRVKVVPHGIPPLPSAPLGEVRSRPVRFGYVGQINRPKGVKPLLQAFSRLAIGAAELHIVGKPQRPGEQEYLDAAMAPCLGRGDVFLHGGVAHDRIAQTMAGFDVLVLPSIYLEVFGLVILEAFSVGRPVIVTACGGPSELVRGGYDGIIVPPNDPTSLWEAMAGLIARPERILEMAANIRPVRTLAQHVNDLESVYLDLTTRESGEDREPGYRRTEPLVNPCARA